MRPPRFTIRMMMVAIVAVAVALGILSMRERSRRQEHLQVSRDLESLIKLTEDRAGKYRAGAAKTNSAWKENELLTKAKENDEWARAYRAMKRQHDARGR